MTTSSLNFGDTRLPERFWSYVAPEPMGGCWLWLGGMVGGTGYGKFWFVGKTICAHRFVVEQLHGEIPADRCVDHVCRVRCCVNPAHLDVVTYWQNQHRSPLTSAARTHCPKGHPYTPENIYEHRRIAPDGLIRWNRDCRECCLERSRQRSAEICLG